MELVLIIVVLLAVWVGVLSYVLYRNQKLFRRLVHHSKGENLDSSLSELINIIDQYSKDQQQVVKRIDELNQDAKFHLQKVKIVRYNPFGDTGGDQSFVLTLLDSTQNGVVLTSLHSRGQTRWYAKNVKAGKGIEHELSKEEINALKETT